MGDQRGGQHQHFAGKLHVIVGERLDQSEPHRDDHLYADRDEQRGLGNFYSKRDSERSQQAGDQLFHGEPDQHHFRFQQHTKLVDDRGGEHCDLARQLYFVVSERIG